MTTMTRMTDMTTSTQERREERKSKRVGHPQMWEWPHVGFGGTGRKCKGPCTKQCAWRKHGSCDTRLAEACPPKFWNAVKHRVEEMRPKWPFWKHRAPKMHLVEDAPTRSIATPKAHLGPIPLLGSHKRDTTMSFDCVVRQLTDFRRYFWLIFPAIAVFSACLSGAAEK